MSSPKRTDEEETPQRKKEQDDLDRGDDHRVHGYLDRRRDRIGAGCGSDSLPDRMRADRIRDSHYRDFIADDDLTRRPTLLNPTTFNEFNCK